MKKQLKLLILIFGLIILFYSVDFTFSIYSVDGQGSVQIETADWVININGNSIVETNIFSVPASNITIDNTNSHASTGYLAPGSTGTISLILDATGSDVSVDYSLIIGNPYADASSSSTGFNSSTSIDLSDSFIISVANSSNLSGTILQNDSSMTRTIQLNYVWNRVDNGTNNSVELTTAGKYLYVPITVTTNQHVFSN